MLYKARRMGSGKSKDRSGPGTMRAMLAMSKQKFYTNVYISFTTNVLAYIRRLTSNAFMHDTYFIVYKFLRLEKI
jgi:hypothetical protein